MLNNLAFEMKIKNVTGLQLAKLIEVQPQAIYLKIQGKSPFKVSEALKIQKEFFPDKSIEYLFKGSIDPNAEKSE